MDPAAAWDDLELGWQTAFTQAWIAFCKGSFPVGAALVDAEGALIAVGRNRIFDPGDEDLAGSVLAHAEVAALRHLAVEDRHDNATLFSTLEPCLFCMGAVVICRVGTVRYAGADAYAGAARLPSTLNAQTRPANSEDGPLFDFEEFVVNYHPTDFAPAKSQSWAATITACVGGTPAVCNAKW